jgi:hypothetical protein
MLILLAGLAIVFTRDYWLPLLGSDNAEPAIIVSTPEETPSSVNFVDPQGDYSLSHPAEWTRESFGSQTQQWVLPEGMAMSIHSEPISPGDTLESYAQEVVSRLPYEVIAQSETQVAGQPAIRQEVAFPGQSQRIAVGYLVFYNGQKYQIALSGLQGLSVSDQERVIQEFEQVLTTFQFQQ